jgi:hypothetical protein
VAVTVLHARRESGECCVRDGRAPAAAIGCKTTPFFGANYFQETLAILVGGG